MHISYLNSDCDIYCDYKQQQTALCIQKIVYRYFTRGRTVLVSMPIDEQPTGRSLSVPPYDNNRALVSFTLTKLHENISWTLRLFPPDNTGRRSCDNSQLHNFPMDTT